MNRHFRSQHFDSSSLLKSSIADVGKGVTRGLAVGIARIPSSAIFCPLPQHGDGNSLVHLAKCIEDRNWDETARNRAWAQSYHRYGESGSPALT